MEIAVISVICMIVGFILGVIATKVFLPKSAENSTDLQVEIAKLTEQNKNLLEQSLNGETLKEMLKNEFNIIANKALVENQTKLSEVGKISLKELLEPVEKGFKEFKNENMKSTIELKSQIDHLKENNIKMINEANELTNALRLNQNVKGAYGESLLETVLNVAGLKENLQYLTRTSFNLETEDSTKRLVPDLIVKLPQNRHIIIDSKFTLESYVEYANEEDKESKSKKYKKFKDELLKRVDELSNKGYTKIPELNTPDFILLYMPLESSLSVVYSDLELVNRALEKDVIIVGTSSLLTTIKLIKHLWLQDDKNRNAQKIADAGAGLFELFVKLCEDLESISDSFDKVQNLFKTSINRFKRGDNLFKKAEELKGLGLSTSKEIPENLLQDVD